jgi:hypothetical protein
VRPRPAHQPQPPQCAPPPSNPRAPASAAPSPYLAHDRSRRCLAAIERLLQHPDAKYVSSTAEALRHGWTDLEVYAERPVHLGPVVAELRQGAAHGWAQQSYMSAAQVKSAPKMHQKNAASAPKVGSKQNMGPQVLRDVETVWGNFRTYFGLHPPHPMNAKLRGLQAHWEQVWHEVASQVNFGSSQVGGGGSGQAPPPARLLAWQPGGGGPALRETRLYPSAHCCPFAPPPPPPISPPTPRPYPQGPTPGYLPGGHMQRGQVGGVKRRPDDAFGDERDLARQQRLVQPYAAQVGGGRRPGVQLAAGAGAHTPPCGRASACQPTPVPPLHRTACPFPKDPPHPP